jgi:hypothetical protein
MKGVCVIVRRSRDGRDDPGRRGMPVARAR